MNILLAVLQLFSILVICLYEYRKKCTSVFLWATLFIIFGIPHFVSILINDIPYNEETLIKSSVFVILFNIVYLVSKVFFNSTIFRKNEVKISLIEEKFLENEKIKYFTGNIYFFLLISSFLILIVFTIENFGTLGNASWGRYYTLNSELGLMSAVRYSNFIFFASAGIALFYKLERKIIKFAVSILIISLYALLTGNRITILPLLVVFIIPYIFNERKTIGFKKLVFFIGAGILTIYFVYSLRLLRIYGGLYNFITQVNFSEVNRLVLNMLISGDGELGLRNAFYYFININNNFPGFNEGHTYLRLLFISVPTTLSFGLKPPDFAITMGSAWTNNHANTTYSMHPTLYGDVFANFWWYGVFAAIFWAMASLLIDRIINRHSNVIKSIFLVMFAAIYVICGRGSVYNGLFIAYISIIISCAVHIFLVILRRKSLHRRN